MGGWCSNLVPFEGWLVPLKFVYPRLRLVQQDAIWVIHCLVESIHSQRRLDRVKETLDDARREALAP